MAVSCFGNTEPVLITAAGILPRNETEICRVMAGVREALEVSGLRDNGKGCLCFDSEEALQLADVFPVCFIFGKLFNPSVNLCQLCCQIVIGE